MKNYRNKIYPPVGFCIYCGTSKGRLTKEHILPFGLGGNWILPSSTCDACAKITREIERFCLRPMLGQFRIRMNLPTRRPKNRPNQLPIRFLRIDGDEEIRSVPTDEYPLSCIGFHFPAPGILRGLPPTEDFEGELIIRHIDKEMSPFVKPEGQRVQLGTINMLNFARMLAKIGHAYAVAELGINAFNPMLPDLILGKTSEAAYLIGGDESTPAPENQSVLHHVYLQDCLSSGTRYVLTAIRLFAFVGMPRYHIVIGRKNM